jgi:opacity protein-like surface antigen
VKMTTAGILALCLCAAPTIASAQTMQWTDKGYISVNGGVQAGSHDLSESGSFPIYGENATFTSTNKVKGGGLIDIGGAYRVWGRNVLAGVSFTHMSSKSDGSLTGSIPDPVITDRPRAVTKEFSDLKHAENAINLNVIWMVPVANKLDIGISAGPTIFMVSQETIPDLTITEPGPTVTTNVEKSSKTTVGFNAGIDVQYMVAKKWGVGGIMRYTVGSVSLPGASEKLTVGGFQIGGGARFRF